MITRAAGACIVLASSLAVGAGVAGAAPAAPCAASQSSIAIVVDFGDASPVSAVCVDVDSTDNGAQALVVRAQQLGTPPPRFNPSTGLLCAIDGVPASGCGDQNGDTYAYWSYWHGTAAGWSYSNVGPAGRAKPSVTEGWRFQPDGAGNPSDPPPRGSADPAATCVPAQTSTPASTESTPAIGDPAPANPAAPPVPVGSDSSTDGATATESSTAASSSLSSASGTAVAAPQGDVRVNDGQAGSSPWSAVGAGAVIIGLGMGGVLIARRRNAAPP